MPASPSIPAHRLNPIETRKKLIALTQQVDSKLSQLWQEFSLLNRWGCALIAVGGYGRKEMYPHSDIDLLILIPNSSPAHINNLGDLADTSILNTNISHFLQACWDNQLHISHSVRNLSECLIESNNDLTVQTALLEARFITGNLQLFTNTQTALNQQMNATDFFQAKKLEMQQRHQRHENTPYNLEPNCKESPGGLRDLHILIWITQAALFSGVNSTPANIWKVLERQHILSAIEAKSLRRAERILQTIRYGLHTLSKRREDRLVFDLQTNLAELLGYNHKAGRLISEVLMQEYYLAAKTVSQLNKLVLQSLERRILGEHSYQQHYLTEHYCEQHGLLQVINTNLFKEDPLQILEVFHLFAEHAHLRDLSADTQRALWNAKSNLKQIRNTEAFKQSFMRFFERGTRLTQTFRLMNSLSILGDCIPDFKRIVGRMQHDLFHVYTVDQHILTVLRNVRRFLIPQHVHEYPVCSQLIRGFNDKPVLYIAALFHDIAKGRGGDHSHLGEQAVKRFGIKMNLSKENISLAMFLVKHHLTLSNTAQKNDLSDPSVIEKFAKLVENKQRLTALYLLTVADIRGTSPKVWNTWKAKLLETLYEKTLYYLNNHSELTAFNTSHRHNTDDDLTHMAQNLVLNVLPKNIQPDALWKHLEDAYFLRNNTDDAAWHTCVLLPRIDMPLTVASRVAPDHTGLQVMVYTKDQQELFVRLCSCFDSQSLSVLTAQVYTTRHGYALDHFLIAFPEHLASETNEKNNAILTQALIAQIESSIQHHLTDLPNLPAPKNQRLPRQARHFFFEPQVHLLPDEKQEFFLLELQAVDQVSLLYRIAQVFAKHTISIHTARITTLGSRAEDFFLISSNSLHNERTQIQLETDLLKAIAIPT